MRFLLKRLLESFSLKFGVITIVTLLLYGYVVLFTAFDILGFVKCLIFFRCDVKSSSDLVINSLPQGTLSRIILTLVLNDLLVTNG